MCGIAGFMLSGRVEPPREVLDTFQQALAHRGPDGIKRHVDRGLGLVHTRLAIIDLKTGDQPLFGPKGTVLIANGEEVPADMVTGEFDNTTPSISPRYLFSGLYGPSGEPLDTELVSDNSRLSVDPTGAPGDSVSYDAAISADGLDVAYSSRASTLVPGDTNGADDVFVTSRVPRALRR